METRNRWAVIAVTLGALALLLPLPAAAQESGAEIVRTIMDRSEARLEGVDSVTVVQETTTPLGTTRRQELRLVKGTRGGRTMLVPEAGQSAAQVMPPASLFAKGDSLRDRSVLRGRSEVDGHGVYVVAIPDLAGLDFGQGALSGASGRSVEADSAIAHVDAESYVPRRIETYGRIDMGGRERAFDAIIRLGDYREVRGYLHPFRTEIQVNVEGMGEQMQALMQKMQESGTDSARRAMMEQAMAAMMGGGISITSTVTELRVNGRGPSGGG